MVAIAKILIIDDNPKYLADALPLYGYDVVKEKLYVTANLNFQTQFADGFKYDSDSTNRISAFLLNDDVVDIHTSTFVYALTPKIL